MHFMAHFGSSIRLGYPMYLLFPLSWFLFLNHSQDIFWSLSQANLLQLFEISYLIEHQKSLLIIFSFLGSREVSLEESHRILLPMTKYLHVYCKYDLLGIRDSCIEDFQLNIFIWWCHFHSEQNQNPQFLLYHYEWEY